MNRNSFAKVTVVLLVVVAMTSTALAGGQYERTSRFAEYEWTETNSNAEWTPRAGLQVVTLGGDFYLMGGRTPRAPGFPPIPGDSDIWGDVWKSRDQGETWSRVLETDDSSHWPARAYFRAVEQGPFMYVLGGQNYLLIPNPDPSGAPFISVSDFFNDVWRSRDGVDWEQMTPNAGWAGRAGLSSVSFRGELYVMGGSFNDDAAVVGGPPARVYFNDVWKSRDGRHWTRLTEHAPWTPRAGAAVVVKNGWLYLLGGEDGFTCLPGGRCPPYYNDVWRSRDGTNWEQVTASAEWSPRPGHQVLVLHDSFVLFGGFGLSADPADPFAAANPMDVWVSRDGADWDQVSDSPWNAASPADIKYDFAAVVAPAGRGGRGLSIFTFGGDRETFNFFDPTNYLNVDNDVWRFSPPAEVFDAESKDASRPAATLLETNAPNPFNPTTTISFALAEPGRVTLRVYDTAGALVRTLVDESLPADRHSVVWDGRNAQGSPVASGVYVYRLTAGTFTETKKMLMMK